MCPSAGAAVSDWRTAAAELPGTEAPSAANVPNMPALEMLPKKSRRGIPVVSFSISFFMVSSGWFVWQFFAEARWLVQRCKIRSAVFCLCNYLVELRFFVGTGCLWIRWKLSTFLCGICWDLQDFYQEIQMEFKERDYSSGFTQSTFWTKVRQNIRFILIGLAVIIVLWGTIFQIGTEEVGVITRMGKFTRTVEPGLNLKMPFLETVHKVPVERQQKLEFGFRSSATSDVESPSEYSKEGLQDESLMLTGDLNLADVEWVVQYRINNAYILKVH
jgi:hypothetical protein